MHLRSDGVRETIQHSQRCGAIGEAEFADFGNQRTQKSVNIHCTSTSAYMRIRINCVSIVLLHNIRQQWHQKHNGGIGDKKHINTKIKSHPKASIQVNYNTKEAKNISRWKANKR